MSSENKKDLGFTYRVAKNGNVSMNHNDILATTLRGEKAVSFIAKMKQLNFSGQQQLMARMTGNYKRGNEKSAKTHPKNRD